MILIILRFVADEGNDRLSAVRPGLYSLDEENFQNPWVVKRIQFPSSDWRHNVNIVKNPPLINASGARTVFSYLPYAYTSPALQGVRYRHYHIGSRKYRHYCSRRSGLMDCVRFKRGS